MKLYTEEQVKEMLNKINAVLPKYMVENITKHVTPIELPSDEEIKEGSRDYIKGTDLDTMVRTFFIAGAKWMKEQIFNQNK